MSATATFTPDPNWRAKGISIITTVSIDVRESWIRAVWQANPTATTSNKRAGRVVIESSSDDGPIYMHGENLEQLADWFEKAAADIRNRKGMPS